MPSSASSDHIEVHLLVLFKRIEEAAFSKGPGHPAEAQGQELSLWTANVCDVAGNPIRESDVLLSGASSLSFDEVVTDALASGALVIPAHIDRPAYSVLANLGFLPDLPIRPSRWCTPPQSMDGRRRSDAHFLEEVGTRRCLTMEDRLGGAEEEPLRPLQRQVLTVVGRPTNSQHVEEEVDGVQIDVNAR